MDGYEATKMVMSRIQSLDPDNASKIMGYLLIQDQPEEEMIRLACGPENHLVSFIEKAKTCLGLLTCTTSSGPSSPSPFNHPISNPVRPKPFSQCSPRVVIPVNNGFNMNPSSPSSPWSGSSFSEHYRSPRPPPSSLSYAAVVNGAAGNVSSSGSSSSFSLPFYSSCTNNCSDLGNDEYNNLQCQEQIPFMDESLWKNVDFMDPIVSPSGRSDSILFPHGKNSPSWVDMGSSEDTPQQHVHRRSCSVSDAFLGGGGGSCEDVAGFGWRPCMYFARGFCKNGSSCKFLHGHGGLADSADSLGAIVGSPGKLDGVDELLRIKAIQQQRLTAGSQLMASGNHPFAYNKCMNFFSNSQRSAATSLMMGDEFNRFGCCRPERNDFGAMGLGGNSNSSSRQIYLTFPADSTFKEEDVSSYFSTFGPVQDVRIPYQQKRMFGFVTFVYPETVKLILAKGNPHFVCDSRVLVKPYKEKGKVPEKKQHQQQMERGGDYPVCFSPSGFDSREPFDIPFGGRMLYNTHEMMLRRKLEEHAELQQAIELQGRRLMNMRLLDAKNHRHYHQIQPNVAPGIPPPPISSSPTYSQAMIFQNAAFFPPPNEEVSEETSPPCDVVGQKMTQDINEPCDDNDVDELEKDSTSKLPDPDVHESIEHILPDNLFTSPTKSTVTENDAIFFTDPGEAGVTTHITAKPSSNNAQVISTLNMALKSCYLQMPRFYSGRETVEM